MGLSTGGSDCTMNNVQGHNAPYKAGEFSTSVST